MDGCGRRHRNQGEGNGSIGFLSIRVPLMVDSVFCDGLKEQQKLDKQALVGYSSDEGKIPMEN